MYALNKAGPEDLFSIKNELKSSVSGLCATRMCKFEEGTLRAAPCKGVGFKRIAACLEDCPGCELLTVCSALARCVNTPSCHTFI